MHLEPSAPLRLQMSAQHCMLVSPNHQTAIVGRLDLSSGNGNWNASNLEETCERPDEEEAYKVHSTAHSTTSLHETSSSTVRLIASWLMTVRPCRTSSCAASPSTTRPAGPLARVTSRTSAPTGPASGLGSSVFTLLGVADLAVTGLNSAVARCMTSPAAPRTETLVALHMAMVKHRSFASSRSSAEESDVAS
eukprot:CAMPEP_0115765216 /NCGR_PEP_ID=MMETSP0272-20121206/102475_1 /TAXON_ID=71861 /ORGANISM="Scrippsiella trochoidea, Strain CCMP3099" /LENGTH=192 /DNA_ID=CAMNT_0003211055 /DNA_START=232 /DNA_END=808 /DNA_ORIENTATION=-